MPIRWHSFAFTLAGRCKNAGFLLKKILSLPLHRHHTARWRSLVGTEQSPLCRHEAQCCWKAASGSRWGITSEKWSNEREEMFNEIWTGWRGVLQQDVLICWWHLFPQPKQFLVWDTAFFSSCSQPEECDSFTWRPVSPVSLFPCLPHRPLTSTSIHGHQSV